MPCSWWWMSGVMESPGWSQDRWGRKGKMVQESLWMVRCGIFRGAFVGMPSWDSRLTWSKIIHTHSDESFPFQDIQAWRWTSESLVSSSSHFPCRLLHNNRFVLSSPFIRFVSWTGWSVTTSVLGTALFDVISFESDSGMSLVTFVFDTGLSVSLKVWLPSLVTWGSSLKVHGVITTSMDSQGCLWQHFQQWSDSENEKEKHKRNLLYVYDNMSNNQSHLLTSVTLNTTCIKQLSSLLCTIWNQECYTGGLEDRSLLRMWPCFLPFHFAGISFMIAFFILSISHVFYPSCSFW